jgi:hypothetical protein
VPRYFFDTHDGELFTPDNTGVALDDLQAAKDEAKKALPDIVKDELPDGGRRTFVIVVKDEGGHALWRVTLSLAVESLSHGSADSGM